MGLETMSVGFWVVVGLMFMAAVFFAALRLFAGIYLLTPSPYP